MRSVTPLVEKRQIRPLNELPEGFSISYFSNLMEAPRGASPIGAPGDLRKGESIVPLEGTMRSTMRDLKVMIPADDNEDLHKALAVAKRSLHGS